MIAARRRADDRQSTHIVGACPDLAPTYRHPLYIESGKMMMFETILLLLKLLTNFIAYFTKNFKVVEMILIRKRVVK